MGRLLGAGLGAFVGAVLAPIALQIVTYLEASNWGQTAPPAGYNQFVLLGGSLLLAPPAAVVGAILGFLIGWRIDRRNAH